MSNETLLDGLDLAMKRWDDTFAKLLDDFEHKGIKITEERLRVAVRNWMRGEDWELPEIARWKLRFALGGVEDNE